MPDVDYVLTSFSPSMLGEGATVHFRVIAADEAQGRVGARTRVVASRIGHARLARREFPGASQEAARYADLKPGLSAIHILYRGPPVPDAGELPAGGFVTLYLIEVEEYQEAA